MPTLSSPERIRRSIVHPGHPDRLRSLQEKLRLGRRITYAAIGGSITEGASASSSWRRYASRLAAALDRRSPCHLANAGIGASDSMFGCFRCGRDVLRHEPDLITIEYAVNDLSNPAPEPSYEALLRQCLALPGRPLVILLFTMRRNGGSLQDLHTAIGRHYGVPMLSYRDAIYPDVVAGRLRWEDISPDEVHPNDDGHALIADLLEAFLDTAPADAGSEALPEPRHPQTVRYLGGRILDANGLRILDCHGWQAGPHKGGYVGFQASEPGAVLEAEFEGTLAVCGSKLYAGDFGRAAIAIDGRPAVLLEGYYEKPAIQAWAGGHTILRILADDLAPGRHRMRLELLADRHPASHGHHFDFGYLLVSG